MKKIQIYILIYLSLFILSINLFYLILNKNNYLSWNFKFENLYNILNLKYKSYKDISNEYNKKYKIYKKKLFLFFEDVHKYHVLSLMKLLNKRFIIKISSQNPVYLIYSVFGCKHLNKKYINSIKIAYFTENQIPDFNIADYAISQAHINYLDRYFRKPEFLSVIQIVNNSYLKIIRNKIINSSIRKKFCAAVISNSLIRKNIK